MQTIKASITPDEYDIGDIDEYISEATDSKTYILTEESIAGGEFLGRRYALEHKERWIDLTNNFE